MLRLIEGWARPSWRAAARRLPLSATASRSRIWCSFMEAWQLSIGRLCHLAPRAPCAQTPVYRRSVHEAASLWPGRKRETRRSRPAMFLKNSWYVAAWADELAAGALLGRTILGEPVLLYRGAAGEVAALEARCCHRGLPLHHGNVVGENVQCGYHGLVYNKTGACIKVPGQDRVPRGAKVKTYPVVEQDHIVWIWMGGAPGLADPAAIVRHPWHDDPKWSWTKDRYLVNANYQLINDNLMDLTHVGYVHTKTIGGTPEAHS